MKRKHIFILLLFSVFSFLFSQTAIKPYYGNGSIENPYQISILNHLYWISADPENWDDHYIQTSNIDASGTSSWTDYWKPIGLDSCFTGSYDGQNYYINNLKVDRGVDFGYNCGFFAKTRNAVIENIRLDNTDVYAGNQQNVGSIIGYCGPLTIVNNCSSAGRVTGSYNTGGLIGYVEASSCIVNSYCDMEVLGPNRETGGFVGYNEGKISFCFALGSVESWSYNAGGFVGKNNGDINDCFSRVSVTGNIWAGGFVGYGDRLAVFDNCYSTGTVTANSYLGGFIGGCYSSTSTVINNCFWDINSSGQATSSGGIGMTTVEMKDRNTYVNAGWDFVNNWTVDPQNNEGYPHLSQNTTDPIILIEADSVFANEARIQVFVPNIVKSRNPEYGLCWSTASSPTYLNRRTEEGPIDKLGIYLLELSELNLNTYYYVRAYIKDTLNITYSNEIIIKTLPYIAIKPAGIGTETSPYEISSLANLYWLSLNSEEWDKHYIQTADIVATITGQWLGSNSFNPIGRKTDDNLEVFNGSYDGRGNVLYHLYIRGYSGDYIGLFGYTQKADIKNIKLDHCYIDGNEYVGGLIGFSDSTKVDSCICVYGRIDGDYYSTGGLIGYSSNRSTISNCYTNVPVLGNVQAGGLVGTNGNSIIEKCSASGTIEANSEIGGLVGRNDDSSIVNNCYSNVDIDGSRVIGGLVGLNYHGSMIMNSYSTGSVPEVTKSGGFVGYNSNSYVSKCFWDTNSSGKLDSDGGGGRSTSEMKDQNTYTDSSWDFSSVWVINPPRNDGYPYLLWQSDIVAEINELIPEVCALHQNYPNPFNPNTTISYQLSADSDIDLSIYDITGKKIKTMIKEYQQAGYHTINWNASDFSSGVYLYRLITNDFVETKKMVLMK